MRVQIFVRTLFPTLIPFLQNYTLLHYYILLIFLLIFNIYICIGDDYMPKLTKIIGPRIKARRKELHISQEKLAELCDISNTHMSSIENGKESLEVGDFSD